jgi:hypothetical protein
MVDHYDIRKRCSFGESIDFEKKFKNFVSIENINMFIDFGKYEHRNKYDIENNINSDSFLENHSIKNVSLYLDDILIQKLDKDFIFIWNDLATTQEIISKFKRKIFALPFNLKKKLLPCSTFKLILEIEDYDNLLIDNYTSSIVEDMIFDITISFQFQITQLSPKNNYDVIDIKKYEKNIVAQNNKIQFDRETMHRELIWIIEPTNKQKYFDYKKILKSATIMLNGHDRFAKREGNYFNYVQPWQHHTRTPIDGIYVYSYCLHPETVDFEELEVDFSRIDSYILDYDIENENLLDSIIKVYCVNGKNIKYDFDNYFSNLLKNNFLKINEETKIDL